MISLHANVSACTNIKPTRSDLKYTSHKVHLSTLTNDVVSDHAIDPRHYCNADKRLYGQTTLISTTINKTHAWIGTFTNLKTKFCSYELLTLPMAGRIARLRSAHLVAIGVFSVSGLLEIFKTSQSYAIMVLPLSTLTRGPLKDTRETYICSTE